jgi:hypothetical protein
MGFEAVNYYRDSSPVDYAREMGLLFTQAASLKYLRTCRDRPAIRKADRTIGLPCVPYGAVRVPAMNEAEEASRIFCDAAIENLAKLSNLPADADLAIFADFLWTAAFFYFQNAGNQSANALHREMAALHRAAERREYQLVATLLQKASPSARALMEERSQHRNIEPPVPVDLRNDDSRDEACDNVAALIRLGGGWMKGRNRPSGRPSRTWKTVLYAPEPSRNFAKRDAERVFIKQLQVAWKTAAGKKPAATACRGKPGPFVRLTEECLNLIGATHVDAIELINDIARQDKGEGKPRPRTRKQ